MASAQGLRQRAGSDAATRLSCVRRTRSAAARSAVVAVRAGKAYTLTLLPGDGIGPEIMAVARKCLDIVVRARTRVHALAACSGCRPHSSVCVSWLAEAAAAT